MTSIPSVVQMCFEEGYSIVVKMLEIYEIFVNGIEGTTQLWILANLDYPYQSILSLDYPYKLASIVIHIWGM